jgi:hypothetical protein
MDQTLESGPPTAYGFDCAMDTWGHAGLSLRWTRMKIHGQIHERRKSLVLKLTYFFVNR